MQETREIVVPGDVVDDTGRLRPGSNTIKEGGRVYAARLGVRSVRGDTVHVVSLSGRYDPQRGDLVIGTVVETGPSNWYIDVGGSGDVGMHVNDVPWRVEFGETAKYLNTGDTVLLKVFHVDELKKVQVTMKDRQARKLTGGIVVDVAPSKVPRIIGRNGSMIGLVKNMTQTRMFVGQNGVIWLDGEPNDVALAIRAIRMIEEQAHTSGLTDKVRAFLEANGGVWREGAAEEDEEAAPVAPEASAPSHREFRERGGWEGEAVSDERAPRRPREDRHGRSFDERRGGRGGRDRGERGGRDRGERGFGRERREGGFREREERREGGFRERREGGEERRGGREERFGERRGREEGAPAGREGGFRERREGRDERRGPREGERREGERREGGDRFGDRRRERAERESGRFGGLDVPGERPPRRFEEERPRRRDDDEERPRRRTEDERPRRRFDDERPRRRDEDEAPRAPARRFGEGEERGGRRDTEPRFGAPREDREARRPEPARPAPKFGAVDEDVPRRRAEPKFGAEFADESEGDEEPGEGPREGGEGAGRKRRRRGGRGRRRGGNGRSEE